MDSTQPNEPNMNTDHHICDFITTSLILIFALLLTQKKFVGKWKLNLQQI